MLFIKKEIAGTPTLVPLTGDVAADPEGVICYVADQDKLSDPVDMTSCVTTDTSTWEAPYDGELMFRGASCQVNGYSCISINGCTVGIGQANSGNLGVWYTVTATVKKGDLVNTRKYLSSGACLIARWYCDRDYDHDGSPWLSPYIANGGGGGGGDLGCHWCSTATYACITNSSNVSLANLTATKAQVGPFTFCGDNGYIYNGADVVTGKILQCADELPATNCDLLLYYVP